MNIEKLKPWNWFKHEDDSENQIPVSKNEVSSKTRAGGNTIISPQQSAGAGIVV